MNSTFQSRARAADLGVSTPVSTIRIAPLNDTSSTGASPNDAATTTAASTESAIQVLPGCGVRPATSCQSATDSLSRSISALVPVTKQVAPGVAGVSLRDCVVCAAMTRRPASSSSSLRLPWTLVRTET